jgi:sugar lactone lactonase YvrE
VRVREGGEVLQVIELNRGCFACVLGGPDRRTLSMTVKRWGGAQSAGGGRRMGQVLTAQAPAHGTGWP